MIRAVLSIVLIPLLSLAALAGTKPETSTHRAPAAEPAFEWYGEASIPATAEVSGLRIGGLSGLYWKDGNFWAVSDDRGKFGPPRVIQGELKFENGGVQLKATKAVELGVTPGQRKAFPVLDMEALQPFGTSWILSSEGDCNHKPRVAPSLFVFDGNLKMQRELPLPDEFIPEAAGRQKKGVQNNFAFEAVGVVPEGTSLWAVPERPLVQDMKDDSDANPHRMLHLNLPDGKVIAQFEYRIEPRTSNDAGTEVFRGVSDMLALSDKKMWVLERGVRIAGLKGLVGTGSIVEVETEGAVLKKKVLLDLEKATEAPRKGKALRNPEAIAWGPALPDGRRILIVMSDNNFSKNEDTEFLFFAVKDAP